MTVIPPPAASRCIALNPKPDGSTPLHERQILCYLARQTSGDIVEVGCNIGVTTKDFALTNPDKTVYAVDYTGPDDTMCAGQRFEKPSPDRICLHARGLLNVVTINQKSAEIDYHSLERDRRVGFIFIDGDHSYSGVQADTKRAFEYFRSFQSDDPRFIVWHDYNESGQDIGQHPEWCNVKAYLDNEVAPKFPLIRIDGTWLAYLTL